MIVRIPLVRDAVVLLEVGDPVWPGSERCVVLLEAGRGRRADAFGELQRTDDGSCAADKRVVGVGRRSFEGDLDGESVHGLNGRDAVERALVRAARRLVDAVAPRENNVLCRHVRLVGPQQPLFQLPGDRHKVR